MLRKISFILIILQLLFSCDITTADEYFKKALELEKQEKFSEAISLLDKAIEKNPRFIPALLNRGADKSDLKKFKEGIDDYKKVLKINPDNTLALFNIGNNYCDLKDYKNAIIFYTKALKTKGALKTNIKMNNDIYSFEYVSIGNYEIYDFLIFFERGIAYLKDKQFDKAISDITKSLITKNAERDCYFLLGKAYLEKKDTINSCANFVKSAKLGDNEAKEMYKKYCNKKKIK